MKEITMEQRDAIEDCIDDMLDGNGMCQLYLYEEGVKDGIRLMRMIRDLLHYVFWIAVISCGGFFV